MTTTKSVTLTLRVDPNIKEGLRLLAEHEHRSLTNMVEVMIRDYCKLHNIAISEQPTLFNSENPQ
ncbi:MAG: ribbon-helix-helix protein, CopG family [Methylococcaceae bacterium]|nr:ribbon-helix-helix protein, CopG family [Methylococcaceae bacterium]MDP2394996.1 ribbon-helix-helix protein, CopG family [Methylococcaceae bacterium]MDP3019522.1 ribbon-helix-helix protein, CopG family [Methylococcaceae bacterium]MDP3389626.1 ribbon-helix-helix protein, CopG family [Methylococcaceae bacterium]MDP3930957.1 ribbon-helix-helix protein, CopG family [Methylococcaceae bacterium]